LNISQLREEGVRAAKEMQAAKKRLEGIQAEIQKLSSLSASVENMLTDIIEYKFRRDGEEGTPTPRRIDHGELVELNEVGDTTNTTLMVTRVDGNLVALVVEYEVSATVRYPTDAELQDHVKGMDSEVLDLLTACRPPAFQPLTEAE